MLYHMECQIKKPFKKKILLIGCFNHVRKRFGGLTLETKWITPYETALRNVKMC